MLDTPTSSASRPTALAGNRSVRVTPSDDGMTSVSVSRARAIPWPGYSLRSGMAATHFRSSAATDPIRLQVPIRCAARPHSSRRCAARTIEKRSSRRCRADITSRGWDPDTRSRSPGAADSPAGQAKNRTRPTLRRPTPSADTRQPSGRRSRDGTPPGGREPRSAGSADARRQRERWAAGPHRQPPRR